MNGNKITSRQIILLLTMFRLSTVISYMPVIHLPPANQDIWIVILLSLFYSVVFKSPLLFFANKFSDITSIERLEKIFGKFIGKFLGVLYGLCFLIYSVFLIIAQTEIIEADILPFVPNWVTIALLIIVIMYIGSKGLTTIFWSGEIIAPITIVSIIFLVIAGINNVDFRELLPILSDSTFYEISLGSIMFPFFLIEIFIFIMGIPYLDNKKDINKTFLKLAVYSLILIAITVVVTQGAIGIEQAKHSNFPFLLYARIINFRQTLERIDPVYVITWISANTIRIIAFIYLSSITFMGVLGKKNNKVILYIISVLAGLASLYITNIDVVAPLAGSINRIFMIISPIFMTIIPTIALIVYFFRRKTINKEEKLQN